MKEKLHPAWFPEARVTCACGNTWVTGASQAEIRTDICSACHPFYTGEQRIVDTEGQVDRFMKRLQVRDARKQEVEDRAAAKTPLTLNLSEIGLDKRTVNLLTENGVATAGDALAKLEGGDDALLSIPGVGRKVLSDLKRALRARGFDVPKSETAAE
ncbi:MAG: 50S ribosomal protein L31 [Chloroflexi bacterium]|jgi:large subunit ribosomal protein L31|nr:50S ribosomal protein L31 [Chloroflexota bacterium]